MSAFISCYIVDDEFRSVRLVESMLKHHFPDVYVVGTHTDARAALLQLKQFMPDLLFLDIHMPEMDGFALLQAWPQYRPEIIFITAYQEYALQAFDVYAAGYLTKPFQTEKFISCVHHAIERIQLKKQKMHHQHAPSSSLVSSLEDKIFVSVGKEMISLYVHNIVFLESLGNYTRIYLKDQAPILVCKQLGKFEQELPALSFCRIHHRYLVQLHHVCTYLNSQHAYVLMSNGMQLPISRRQKKHFQMLIQRYAGV